MLLLITNRCGLQAVGVARVWSRSCGLGAGGPHCATGGFPGVRAVAQLCITQELKCALFCVVSRFAVGSPCFALVAEGCPDIWGCCCPPNMQ